MSRLSTARAAQVSLGAERARLEKGDEMTYSDELLRRYLDGALPDERANAIEAALATDPALERRLMALDPCAGMVADAFGGQPGTERVERLRAAIPAKRRFTSLLPGAAMAASLAFGIAIGNQLWPAGDTDTPNWRLEVARYQALYTPETVGHLASEPARLMAELDRAAEAVGLPLPANELAAVAGLTLRRAQVLGFEGKALIQLAYTDAAGTPFALCIMPHMDDADGEAELAGLSTYSWAAGTHSFILVGRKPQSEVTRLAAAFRKDVL